MGICCLMAGLGVFLGSLCLLGWVLVTDRRCGLWLLAGASVFLALRLTVCTECEVRPHQEIAYCGVPPATHQRPSTGQAGAGEHGTWEPLTGDQIARNEFLKWFFEKGVWVYGLASVSRAVFLLSTTKRALIVSAYGQVHRIARSLTERVSFRSSVRAAKEERCACGPALPPK
jgi:hypothetical protein